MYPREVTGRELRSGKPVIAMAVPSGRSLKIKLDGQGAGKPFDLGEVVNRAAAGNVQDGVTQAISRSDGKEVNVQFTDEILVERSEPQEHRTSSDCGLARAECVHDMRGRDEVAVRRDEKPGSNEERAEALTRRVRTNAHHRRYGSLHHLDRGKKRIADGGRLGRRSAGRNGNSYRYHGHD